METELTELSAAVSASTNETPANTKEVPRPESFDNARGVDESWEDYVARRKAIRVWMRQHRFFSNVGTDNRAMRRKHTKLRFTKPKRYIRGKYIIGRHDVTLAVKREIPMHHYLRIAELGLKHKDLAELGKALEGKYGTNTD